MKRVSQIELRRRARQVLHDVERGATFVVTRNGVEVAELRPRARRRPSVEDLIARRRSLPPVDPRALRHDVDDPPELPRPGEPD